MLCISFPPLRVGLTAIRHRNASMLKYTVLAGGGRCIFGVILENNNVLIDVKQRSNCGMHQFP